MKQKKNKSLFIAKIAAFCIILAGCAAKPINQDLEGFLGIAWGENITTAVSILKENDFTIKHIGSEHEGIRGIYAEGIFMNEDVYLHLLFYNDKFESTNIRFKKTNNLELYNEISNLLTEKYGKPFIESKTVFIQNARWNFRNSSWISASYNFELNSMGLLCANDTIRRE